MSVLPYNLMNGFDTLMFVRAFFWCLASGPVKQQSLNKMKVADLQLCFTRMQLLEFCREPEGLSWDNSIILITRKAVLIYGS